MAGQLDGAAVHVDRRTEGTPDTISCEANYLSDINQAGGRLPDSWCVAGLFSLSPGFPVGIASSEKAFRADGRGLEVGGIKEHEVNGKVCLPRLPLGQGSAGSWLRSPLAALTLRRSPNPSLLAGMVSCPTVRNHVAAAGPGTPASHIATMMENA